jgi:hypothetical protein
VDEIGAREISRRLRFRFYTEITLRLDSFGCHALFIMSDYSGWDCGKNERCRYTEQYSRELDDRRYISTLDTNTALAR